MQTSVWLFFFYFLGLSSQIHRRSQKIPRNFLVKCLFPLLPVGDGGLQRSKERLHHWALVCSFSGLSVHWRASLSSINYQLPLLYRPVLMGDFFSWLWASGMTKRGNGICSVTATVTVQNTQQSASHIKGNIQYLQITADFNHASLRVLLLSKNSETN